MMPPDVYEAGNDTAERHTTEPTEMSNSPVRIMIVIPAATMRFTASCLTMFIEVQAGHEAGQENGHRHEMRMKTENVCTRP